MHTESWLYTAPPHVSGQRLVISRRVSNCLLMGNYQNFTLVSRDCRVCLDEWLRNTMTTYNYNYKSTIDLRCPKVLLRIDTP